MVDGSGSTAVRYALLTDCTCPAHALAASRNFLCSEDVDVIHRLATELPADRYITVIDLGAGAGTTALAVMEKRAARVMIISVDTDTAALNWAGLAVKNVGRSKDWHAIPLSAEATAEWYKGEPPALLLHDAGHTRAAIDRDLRAWLPKLPAGTPVWVHDYGVAPDASKIPGETYPGVTRAVDRLVRDGLLVRDGVTGWGWYGRCAT